MPFRLCVRAVPAALALVGLVLAGCGRPLQEGELAFISFRGQDHRLYRTRDGGRATELLMPDIVNSDGWSFSPDGRRIAFAAGPDDQGDVFVANADGSVRMQVTRSPANERDVAWSPDGTRLAYVSYRSGNDDIFLAPVPRSANAPVTEVNWSRGEDYDGTPAWGPHGKRLAFASDRDHFAAELYVADVGPSEHLQPRPSTKPTGLRRLTHNEVPDHCPTWAPDGGEIAFVSDRPAAGSGFNLYAVDPHSGQERLILDAPGTIWSPTWHPSGRAICFAHLDQDRRQIGVIRSDGSDLRWVVGDDESAAYPRWLPLQAYAE